MDYYTPACLIFLFTVLLYGVFIFFLLGYHLTLKRALAIKFYYWYADTLIPFCGKLDKLLNKIRKCK